jgi:hypothetical protein
MKSILIIIALFSVAAVKASPEISYTQRVLLGYLGTLYMFGFLLAYSCRKKLRVLRKTNILPGRTLKDSLELHILTGLLGPWLILLHTSMSFHGMAGVSAGLMVVVVMSGITGRYIYNRVRKMERALKRNSPEAVKQGAPALNGLEKTRKLLGKWRSVHIPLTTLFFITVILHILSVYYY